MHIDNASTFIPSLDPVRAMPDTPVPERAATEPASAKQLAEQVGGRMAAAQRATNTPGLPLPSRPVLGKEELEALASLVAVAAVSSPALREQTLPSPLPPKGEAVQGLAAKAAGGLAAGTAVRPSQEPANAGLSFKSDEQIAAFLMLMQVLSESATAKRGLRGKLDQVQFKAEMNEAASLRRSGMSALGHAIGSAGVSLGLTVGGAYKSNKGLVQQRQSIRHNEMRANAHRLEAGTRGNALEAARSNQASLQRMAPAGGAQAGNGTARATQDLNELDAVTRTPHAQNAAQASLDHELLMNKGQGAQAKGQAVMQTAQVASGVVNGSGQLAGSLESAEQKVDSAAANAANKGSGNERDSYAADEALLNQFFNLLAELTQSKNSVMAAVAANIGVRG